MTKTTDAHRVKMRGPTERLRDICLALPEAEERETWETPTYRVRGKIFALQSAVADRDAVWCKAQEGSQELLVQADPERFFRPPYLGHKGWVGMWLDRRVDWKEVAELVRRSYRLIAPKKLAAKTKNTGVRPPGQPDKPTDGRQPPNPGQSIVNSDQNSG